MSEICLNTPETVAAASASGDGEEGGDGGDGGDGATVMVGGTAIKIKKLKVKHDINLENCKYSVVGTCVGNLGWRVRDPSESWDIHWMDISVSDERIMKLKRGQKINHFPGMIELRRKCRLAANMKRMALGLPQYYGRLTQETFILPAERSSFEAACNKEGATIAAASEKRTVKTYIIKPDDGACGQGIFLTRKASQVPPTLNCVAQRYLTSPMLIDERKFDLRIYVLLTSVTPLRLYVYEEGIARFATMPYSKPTAATLNERFMHLTNYSVNKKSDAFVSNTRSVKEDAVADDCAASKRTLSFVRRWLRENGFDEPKFWAQLKDLIRKTVISVLPHLQHVYKSCIRDLKDIGFSCFDLMGFDVIMDKNARPILIEVNEMPSFDTNAPIDFEVKHKAITETLQMIATPLSERKLLKAFSGRDDDFIKREELIQLRCANEEARAAGFTRIFPLQDDERHLMKKEDQHDPTKEFKIFVGSWNLNNASTGESLMSWLEVEGLPDMFVIGFQEVDLTAMALMVYETAKGKEWEEWVQIMLDSLIPQASPGDQYVKICSRQMVGIQLLVFSRQCHLASISHVETAIAAVGVMGVMGNKGAVCARFKAYGTTFCVVNSHLAAHDTELERRNQDYHDIMKKIVFSRGKKIMDATIVIWLGDLNYRIELSPKDCKAEIATAMSTHDWSRLYALDQLQKQRRDQKAFGFFDEGKINFAPTFKYDPNSDSYDSSSKNRTPSWTDRIMWRKGDNIILNAYQRVELFSSDHKPVMADFTAFVANRIPRDLAHTKKQNSVQTLAERSNWGKTTMSLLSDAVRTSAIGSPLKNIANVFGWNTRDIAAAVAPQEEENDANRPKSISDVIIVNSVEYDLLALTADNYEPIATKTLATLLKMAQTPVQVASSESSTTPSTTSDDASHLPTPSSITSDEASHLPTPSPVESDENVLHWHLDSVEDGVEIDYAKPLSPTISASRFCMRGKLTIPAPAPAIVFLLWDVQNRPKWDDLFLDPHVLEDYSNDVQALQFSTRQVGKILGQRCMTIMQARSLIKEDGTRIIAYKSVQHRLSTERRMQTRGHLEIGGFVISPTADKNVCSVTLVLDFDPTGMIPPQMAKSFVKKQMETLGYLRTRLQTPVTH